MKKQTFTLLTTLSILLITSSNLFATGGNMGGPTQDGSAETPYLIQDFNDFQAFANDPNYWAQDVHTQLDCNLDLDPNLPGRQIYTTAVIAPDTDNRNRFFNGMIFAGIFDGNDYTINNLTISSEDNGYLGLFGKISASISNLGFQNINITGMDFSGGLCGVNYYGTIANCYTTGSVAGHHYSGGLCGFNDGGTIINCYNKTKVTGDRSLGGICGANYNGNIIYCYNTNKIIAGASSRSLGGICGANQGGDINYSYSTGSVTGDSGSESLGGLCGYNEGSITNCHTTGAITLTTSGNRIGGLCGYNYQGNISHCYSTASVTGGIYSNHLGGLCGENNNGGTISNCYANGAVNGKFSSNHLGGLCGYNYNANITNCYATGAIISGSDTGPLGGLCGSNNNGGNITYCYSTGSITAGEDIEENYGGLCGHNSYSTIKNCVWDMEASDMTYSEGGIGQTTTEMKTVSTFLGADWDLVNVWNIEEGQTYPLLRKYSAFDTNYDNKVNFIDFAEFANHWLEGVEDEPEPQPGVDNEPPLPNPSQWLVLPYEINGHHTMSAVVTSDAATGGNDPVWYKFEVVGGYGIDSQWQLSNEYVYQNSGNVAYQVKACDSIPGSNPPQPNPDNSTVPSEAGATYE